MDTPLTAEEFRALLDALLAPIGAQGEGPLAIAVSGGGDSMALLLLVHAAYPGRVTALTVDHGLRANSASEAGHVGTWCDARGIPHRILTWTGQKPATGIQAAARSARYALLAAAAVELGADCQTRQEPLSARGERMDEGFCTADGDRISPLHLVDESKRSSPLGEGPDRALAAPLLVAHTLDDQAETLLLRLAHKSQLAGLAAMRASSEIAGAPPVPLLRPLLGVSGARLRATLRAMGHAWIEDPSNDNPVFERVRIRRMLPTLAAQGIDSALLARTSRLMARIDDLLSARAQAACRWLPEGAAMIDTRALGDLPSLIAPTLVSRIVRSIGAGAYPPRGAALDGLIAKLMNPAAKGATLAGCRFARIGPDSWLVMRELRAALRAPPATLCNGPILWDNRFWVRAPRRRNDTFTIAPIGASTGLAGLAAQGLPTRLAHALTATLPGLWQDGRLMGLAPIAAGWEAWIRRCEEPAALFVGRERVEGRLCALWRQGAQAAQRRETVKAPRVS